MTETGASHTEPLAEVAEWIRRREWLVIAVLAVPLLFPRPSWTPLLLVLPVLWALNWWRSGSPFPTSPLNVPILLLALMLLVSLWATYSIAFSLPKISALVFSLAVFFAVLRLAEDHFSAAMVGYLFCGLAVAVLGFVGTDWPAKIGLLGTAGQQLPQMIRGLPGAEAGIHPNELGGVLILFASPALVTAARGRLHAVPAWAARTSLGLMAAVIVLVIVLTQSRSALMGLGAGLALLMTASGRKARILLSILVLIGIVAVVQIGPTAVLGLDQGVAVSALGEITFASRVEIWSRGLYGLQDFVVTGMGMGTFRRVAPVLYPFFTIPPGRDVAHAHNLFLQTGLDLGVPGLVAYLALWLSAFAMLGKVRIQRHSRPLALGLRPPSIALGLAGGMISHAVFGLTDAVALGARPGFLWWYLLGMAAALYRLGDGD